MSQVYPSLLYLWQRRTLYIGPFFEPLCVAQGAASLSICLDGALKLFLGKGVAPISCKSVLMPPGIHLKIDTGDSIVAHCMLDPLGRDYTNLNRRMVCHGNSPSGIAYTAVDEASYIKFFLELYQQQYGSTAAWSKLDQLLAPSECDGVVEHPVDQRVERVISLIKERITDNLSITELAEAVNISVPRLVQIFKNQTGIPIRRYRMWHRLYVLSISMANSGSLTTAAADAGFVDSPHFCRTFQSMFGMRPSLLFGQPNGIKIIPEMDCISGYRLSAIDKV